MITSEVAVKLLKSYLICTSPRSGSWLLADGLESTGIAGRPKEYFEPEREVEWFNHLGIEDSSEYLPQIIQAGSTPNGVFGAKVFRHQFKNLASHVRRRLSVAQRTSPTLFAPVLPDLQHIWLIRKNRVAQAVSWYRAIMTDQWFVVEGEPDSLVPTVPFDFTQIDRRVRWLTRYETLWQRYFLQHGITPLVIEYEEIMQNYHATIKKVLDYLEIPIPVRLGIPKPRFKKQADATSTEWIELYHRLSRTEVKPAKNSPLADSGRNDKHPLESCNVNGPPTNGTLRRYEPVVEKSPPQNGSMVLKCFALRTNPPSLAPARADRAWMDAFPSRHAYRCLPLSIANSYGWEVLSPTTFSIYWNGGMQTTDIHFESHDHYPDLDHLAMSNFSRGVVTFHTGYLFRTEPGWNLLASGPFNQPKDGISPMTGVVETDWLPYPFTMNWQLTRPGIVRFEKDEPFCVVFPVLQQALQNVHLEILPLESDPVLASQHQAWRQKRDEFMAKFRAGDPSTLKEAWQKYYFKGELPTGQQPITDHVQKLRLPAPVDQRPKPKLPLTTRVVVTAASIPVQDVQQPAELVARASPGQQKMDILYLANFLSAEACDELMAAFERCQDQLIAAPGRTDRFFDHRFLWITSLPDDTERKAKKIMQTTRFRCIEEIRQFYHESEPLYSDTMQLVKWTEGMNMPVHADNSNPDGRPHPTPFRKYASVVFLNDNYGGGELFLPRLEITIKPRKGLLVAFRGDRSHEHGVHAITHGTRYTMPGWYADDVRHRDPSSLQAY
jgi:LPS sulfotransferase NodH/predicted 2-oxoglutarate/Fe(II)-dependent dioxygenase YbiX